MTDERFYTLALTAVPGVGPTVARKLIDAMGSAEAVFSHRRELARRVTGIGDKTEAAFLHPDEAFRLAERELAFCEKSRIRCLTLRDEDYPARLRECGDAPTVLFFRGNADLNAPRVVSVVGTRRATAYGEDICTHLMADLRMLCPDVMVVSGLAYGIDIRAHRAALQHGLPTMGVLAHGLDRIYPSVHRQTAIDMLEQGGLVSEFMSGTSPDRMNFVRRNRIIAGISDAVIVVESPIKGGALITADLAGSYHRDCFAFPGRWNDEYSAGCNRLIRTNQAALINSAEELVEEMGWKGTAATPKAAQGQLFPNLTDEEARIVERLRGAADGLQVNTLVAETGMTASQMSVLLFGLEMKGVVEARVGGMYRLTK